MSGDGKVIDLLSSDSEDDHGLTEASAVAKHCEKSNAAPPMVSQSQEGEYDSDDSLMNSEPVFLNKKPAAKPTR